MAWPDSWLPGRSMISRKPEVSMMQVPNIGVYLTL
jgi:hypothetical protein